MQVAKAEVRTYYKSGFPKEMTRGKYGFKLNERLKSARNRKKLTSLKVVQELQARGVSIAQSTLQGYEASEESLNHRYPSLPVLIGLADYYECSLDYLLGTSDRIKRNDISPKEIDLIDLLESDKSPVVLNGAKLCNCQKTRIIEALKKIPLTN